MNKKSSQYMLIAAISLCMVFGCLGCNKKSGNTPDKVDVADVIQEENTDKAADFGSAPSDADEAAEIPTVAIANTEPEVENETENIEDEKIEEPEKEAAENNTESAPVDNNGRVSAATGEARKFNSTKRIICIGDSMMEGYGGKGTTCPSTLADLSGAETLNYGVYAEKTTCIAARIGSNPQYLVEDIIIPADETPVKAQFSGKYGWEMLLVFGDSGINNAFIDGIEGKYYMSEDGERVFSRITPGEEKHVSAGTQLITHAMVDKRPDDIVLVWCGTNDEPNSQEEVDATIGRLKEMIDYLGTDKYVVINETCQRNRFSMLDELNEAHKRVFGEHSLNMRDYLINNALDVLGIEPNDYDREALARGDVPASIRIDDIHGNKNYYTLVGEQVYKKMVELGYLK